MAWSIPTYAGVRATGSPSNYRLGMFELIRAVHEREIACGYDDSPLLSPTTFYKADGTLSSTITMSDLLGLPCSGPNHLAGRNLIKIRTAILSLASFFTETSGESDVWTTETLSTAIGYDLTQGPSKINDAAYWQAMQDALDLLLYPWGTRLRTLSFGSSGGYSDDFTYNTISGAWGGRNDNANSGSLALAQAGIGNNPPYTIATYWGNYVVNLPAIPGPSGVLRLGNDFFKAVNDVSATIVQAKIDAELGGGGIVTPFSGTVNGSSVTIDNGVAIETKSLSPWDMTIGTSFLVALTIPSTNPFDELSGPSDVGVRYASITIPLTAVRVYLDISAELTDQAP